MLTIIPPGSAEKLYDVAKNALYVSSYVQILREHPDLKGLIVNDGDRFCMLDMYRTLSWRIGKKEKPSDDAAYVQRIRGFSPLG
jgi:hypothetical protein